MEFIVKPTIYNHHKFRSRLEARWAVYFDAIGLEYEYEKEGFILEDGESYLPDFWFPQVNMWAEVKPKEFTRAELKKVWYLVRGSQKECILLEGQPDNKSYLFISLEDVSPKKFENFGRKQMSDCVVSMYHHYPTAEHRFYMETGVSGGCQKRFDSEEWSESDPFLTKDAVERAKTFQFEYAHDESR
jgi:hypothetical protein